MCGGGKKIVDYPGTINACEVQNEYSFRMHEAETSFLKDMGQR